MVTFEDVWKPTDEAAKILGLNPEDIELMTTGMNMVADRHDGGKLINMKGIEDFLQKIQKISNRLFSTIIVFENKEEGPVWINGRKAAKILSIPYEAFADLCKNGQIKGSRKARGWRVNKKDLNEFALSNQDIIKSLQIEQKKIKKSSFANSGSMKKKEDDPPPPEEPIEDKPKQNEQVPTDHSEYPENPVAPPEETKESIKKSLDNQDPQKDEEVLPQEPRTSYTIRTRKHNGGYYCRIDDVATGLSMAQERIKRWIKDKRIKAVEATESSQITWYIERESLKIFLEKNNISITFDNH